MADFCSITSAGK